MRGDPAGCEAFRVRNDQRHTGGPFVEGLFEPHATLTHHLAMVHAEDDNRVIGESRFLEDLHDPPDLVVHVAGHRVIGVAHSPEVFLGDGVLVLGVRVVQPLTVRVEVLVGDLAHARQVDVFAAVAVPVLLGRDERRVRMREGHGHEERALFRGAREVVQLLQPVVFDLVVVIDLQAAHARSGFDHGTHADAGGPVVRALEPVRGPAEVGRVNVGGQAFLEPVQLVGSDEVHLAAEDCAIPRVPQVMRHRRRSGRKLGGVVERVDRMRQAPGQHRRAGRRADGEVAIGAVEDHAGRGEL